MNKIGYGVLSAILLFGIAAQPGLASVKPKTIQFSLNLGAAASGDGDIGPFVGGFEDYARDLADLLGLQKSSDIEWTKWGRALGGEVILGFSPRVRLGLGIGLISKARDNRAELGPYPLIEGKLDFGLSVVPMTLTGYLFFPVSEKSQIYIKGGPSFYWGRFRYDVTTIVQGVESRFEGEIRDGAPGFQGGLGIEAVLSDRLTLFAEAAGRYVKSGDWIGDETELTEQVKSAPVWYAEEAYGGGALFTGRYYPSIVVADDSPQSSRLKNVRRFETNFSGVQIQVGIRIGFDL